MRLAFLDARLMAWKERWIDERMRTTWETVRLLPKRPREEPGPILARDLTWSMRSMARSNARRAEEPITGIVGLTYFTNQRTELDQPLSR
jgi:hypothetical protein